jgi:hypothetical protein
MPLDHGRRFHQHHQVQTPRPHPVEPDPEEAVYGEEPGTTGALAAQDGQLVAQCDDLKLQGRAASAAPSDPREHLQERCEHLARLWPDAQNRQTCRRFRSFCQAQALA